MATAAKRSPTLGAKKGDPEPAEARGGKLGWILGWVVVPLLVVASIVGAGAHVGASNPEAWYVRVVVWVVGLFA